MNIGKILGNLVRHTKHSASKKGYKHTKGAGTTLTDHQRVVAGRSHE